MAGCLQLNNLKYSVEAFCCNEVTHNIICRENCRHSTANFRLLLTYHRQLATRNSSNLRGLQSRSLHTEGAMGDSTGTGEMLMSLCREGPVKTVVHYYKELGMTKGDSKSSCFVVNVGREPLRWGGRGLAIINSVATVAASHQGFSSCAGRTDSVVNPAETSLSHRWDLLWFH